VSDAVPCAASCVLSIYTPAVRVFAIFHMKPTFRDGERHQYAMDAYGKWVYAPKHEHQGIDAYYCGCPDRHRLKFVKPSGKDGKRKFKPYFGHVTAHGKRKNNSTYISCRGGGESPDHQNAKHRLRELLGQYSFVVRRCPTCMQEEREYGLGSSIEMEIRSSDRLWRYDCMLKRDGVPVMALEIAHTHFTSADKVASTRAAGVGMAEFRAREVLSLKPGGGLTNLQIVIGQCIICGAKAAQAAILQAWEAEIRCLAGLDNMIAQEMESEYQFRKFKQTIVNASMFDKVWSILSRYKKLMRFKAGYLGEIGINKLFKTSIGFLIETCCMKSVFIMLVTPAQSSDAGFIMQQMRSIGQSYAVRKESVIIIHLHTVVNALDDLEIGSKTPHEPLEPFKSCTWALLKSFEKSNGVCARCFVHGHTSEKCKHIRCGRCGITGHSITDCIEKYHRNGTLL